MEWYFVAWSIVSFIHAIASQFDIWPAIDFWIYILMIFCKISATCTNIHLLDLFQVPSLMQFAYSKLHNSASFQVNCILLILVQCSLLIVFCHKTEIFIFIPDLRREWLRAFSWGWASLTIMFSFLIFQHNAYRSEANLGFDLALPKMFLSERRFLLRILNWCFSYPSRV